MKRAVSISIGSAKRDKRVEVDLLGQKISLERVGTDGDMQKAANLYRDLDGKVDAFGVGGTGLGFKIDDAWYPLHSVLFMIKEVRHTPVVDGTGFKSFQERRAAHILEEKISDKIRSKRVLLPSAIDRYSLALSFIDAGYECIFGDLMFALGLPFTIRSRQGLKMLAKLLLPIAGRLPFHWLYPIGESQEERRPKWEKFFHWASVIAGDCHYITRYMPDQMEGKVIVTNTTTKADRELFKTAGVKYLLTTTPVLDGRSFGTNLMESGLVAAIGWKQSINYANSDKYFQTMQKAIEQLRFPLEIQALQN